MASGQSIVSRALRLLNALGTGESVGTDLRSDMLGALNKMLDSWNLERGIIHSVKRQTFTLIASTNPHTIGATGQIVVARPVKIDNASIVDGTTEHDAMEKLSLERWQEISDKATSGLPRRYFYDPQLDANGLARLYLWPVPLSAYTLVLYLWEPLTTGITWAGSVSFPPGYERAIEFNLAIEIAPEVHRTPSEAVVKVTIES